MSLPTGYGKSGLALMKSVVSDFTDTLKLTIALAAESSRIRERTSLETEMADHRVCCRMKLGDSHRPTGKTRHYRGGEECPPPAELRIIQFSDDPGFYLLYYDATGEEITDTYHESIDEAKAQAAFEFEVTPEEWECS
jgi:hypothetical protein